MHEISREEARNALALAHGFVRQECGKEGVLEVLNMHKCIQQDPIDVAGRNADLTLQSRVKDYRREHLNDLLYEDRRLFEYFCKMMSVLPVETYPIFKHKMKAFERKVASFLKEHRREIREIMTEVENGPVSSKELGDMGKTEYGWGHRTNVSNVILTRLWVAGKLLIHHREGVAKYYALPEEVIPKDILKKEGPAKGEDVKEIAKLIIKASRLVSPSKAPEQWYDVGKTKEVKTMLEEFEKEGEIFSIRLSGFKEKLYAPKEDEKFWEDSEVAGCDYVRFIAPLDPLLWNRSLFKTVYGMDYSWEVYKKPGERRYGYYCLPIIFNGRAVGLIEPSFKKKERVLEIKSFHVLDKKIDEKCFLAALENEMRRFSIYLGSESLEVKKSNKWLNNLSF